MNDVLCFNLERFKNVGFYTSIPKTTYLHVSLVSFISLSSSLLLRTAPILSALSAPNYGKKGIAKYC